MTTNNTFCTELPQAVEGAVASSALAKQSWMQMAWRLCRKVLAGMWWLTLCYLPISLFGSAAAIQVAVGCPANSDCYLPGAFEAEFVKASASLMAVLVWPAACVTLFRGIEASKKK